VSTSGSGLVRMVAGFAALAVLATACASGDDDDGGGGGAGASGEGANQTTVTDEGEPVRGGDLVYGIEADSANGWAPFRTSCASACYIPLSAVSDSIFAVTDEGELVPLLAESAEPNADYTTWTITLREGIRFHDGTPLDAEAVKFNIESCAGSTLVGAAYSAVGPITAEGQTVTIQTRDGQPWATLPAYLSYGSCGYMFSPDWLASLADVPQRQPGNPFYDAELAATPATGDPAAPVGLGAFVFESYRPGNGNSFRAVRNEDYWRGPDGITGEELPYLDSIEAVVAVDVDSRSNALRSGQFDIMQTRNADNVADFLDDSDVEVMSSDRYADTGYLLLNVAQGNNALTGQPLDPAGANADNPMTTLACRRALAHALDRDRLVEERGAGLIQPANGPFPPGTTGHLEDTGYPAYDVEAAQSEMASCLEERGTDSIEFSFNTTNDPYNVETNQLILSMWQEVFGDQVQASITPIEQGQYITTAVMGDFDVLAAANHSGDDPDLQRVWWSSVSSAPIGGFALNFGRFSDEVIDENLATIRTSTDDAERTAAAEAVNRRFGEQVYNLWLSWSLSGLVSAPYVNGHDANVLPDGTEGLGLALALRHQVTQIWCDGGTCE
jgi:peptide/nickel transport system substrate-binding protein